MIHETVITDKNGRVNAGSIIVCFIRALEDSRAEQSRTSQTVSNSSFGNPQSNNASDKDRHALL
jgi:hypothetical protein